jgi:tryptophan synthase alpha chain
MASRIDDIFSALRSEGRTTLIPFVTAGYPTLEATDAAIAAFEQILGPTIIELGIPFSDPIADGPIIAASMHEALAAGVTPARVFETVRRVRSRIESALVAMVSASIVRRMDPPRFVADAAEAGFDGLIVPDLGVSGDGEGEDGVMADLAAAHGLAFSLLVAPTTSPRRLERIVSRCSGFVYLLARTGITGERESLPDVAGRVEAVRRLTDLPVVVGFGVSRPAQVAAVTAVADGAVVGSAIVRRMNDANDPVGESRRLVEKLASALSPRQGVSASDP